MKKFLLALILCIGCLVSYGQTNTNTVKVSGYYTSSGTYVQPYTRTAPNTTNWDNYSTVGNVNTYTYTSGTVPRDYSSAAYNYSSNKTIYTGSRGGQYYINSNGNKSYVPKTTTTYSSWW